jgi:16S rRNA (cytidine1402-2'-O)-methyltransferase
VAGSLWIVATPIGTLADLSDRARDVLAGVDLILAEDTRRARRLLSHVGLTAGRRLMSLHEHNEEQRTPRVLDHLRDGRDVALICDAGTPVLSDPGFLLVRSARAAGIRILSVPGPSAFTAALAAAGQPSLPATLAGFLPHRTGARRRRIAELARAPWTLVVLLSPHRLQRELHDLAELLGDERPATLLAELSKVHERAVVGTLAELAEQAGGEPSRGEHVIVIGPPPEPAGGPSGVTPDRARHELERARNLGLDRRQSLQEAAGRLGIGRRELYALLLAEDDADDGAAPP